MLSKSINIIALSSLLLCSGCSNEATFPEAGKVAISLSAKLPSAAVVSRLAETRADDAFPNNGSISVLAANVKKETDLKTADWTSDQLFLDHVSATANRISDNNYSVSFDSDSDSKLYWPFNPENYLGFLAYSPQTHNSLTVSDTNLKLDINASDEKFPDLLYIAPAGPFNKESKVNDNRGEISLGEFQHAMAKLVVKVIVIDENGQVLPSDKYPVADLRLDTLDLSTKVTQGTFDLLSSEWELTAPETGTSLQKVYSLMPSEGEKLPYDSSDRQMYLLPSTSAVNTVELSSVYFSVSNVITGRYVHGTLAFNQFEQEDQSVIQLEKGKETILTIKLQYTDVPTDTNTIILEGQLVDWNEKGTSTVVIE